LHTYESERLAVTEQVSRSAMNTSLVRQAQGRALPDSLEQPGPEGEEVRVRIGRESYDSNVGQFCCGGLNFSYFYKDSPIIVSDESEAPSYTLYAFTQSTFPDTEPHTPGCATGNHFMMPWELNLHFCVSIRQSR
jgi:hypothetical protein